MKATPLFLGACALASVAGAVWGATTNTQPIQLAGIGMEMLPERHLAFDASDDGLPDAAPPDHYAMVTPHGRVEVSDLSTRGLYSQQRYGWREASYVVPAEAAFVDRSDEDTWSVEEPASPAPPAITAPAAPAPVAPIELSAPAAPRAETGQPRIIDVSAELASAG